MKTPVIGHHPQNMILEGPRICISTRFPGVAARTSLRGNGDLGRVEKV